MIFRAIRNLLVITVICTVPVTMIYLASVDKQVKQGIKVLVR